MEKKLVIITGASSGIGLEMAKLFSEAGNTLGLIARRIEPMLDLDLPNCVCKSADVRNFETLRLAVEAIQSQLGDVDCMINNAGVLKSAPLNSSGHDVNENMVQVNVQGVINGIEAVLEGMKERKTGTIINTASIAGLYPRPTLPVYAATKAAVKSLSESVRQANAKYGIRVCNLAPAKTDTPLIQTAGVLGGNSLKPEDIARVALMVYQQPSTVCIRDVVVCHTTSEV